MLLYVFHCKNNSRNGFTSRFLSEVHFKITEKFSFFLWNFIYKDALGLNLYLYLLPYDKLIRPDNAVETCHNTPHKVLSIFSAH